MTRRERLERKAEARERANRRDAKAHEHGEMARHHQEKAAALRSHLNRTIFSDDEDAIQELEAKIERLEAEREHAKTVNRAWRGAGKPSPDDANGWGKVADKLGVALDDLKTARLNLARDCLGRAPYPSYVSQNLGGRIRQARQRIDSIRRHAEKAAKAEDAGGVVIEDTANGYCTVSFAEKPDRSVLDALKAAGFRWSRPSWIGKRADLPDEIA